MREQRISWIMPHLARREHGRHIYAYCHTRTNQVLYSLTRTMDKNHVLKQLPDVGANWTPPSLRKDSWRPFWTLSMPPGQVGMAQGLRAFRQLREWRKLHEYNWERPALLDRPFTDDEIKALKKERDARGGNKAESVYDYIKRLKKKMRVRAVVDQKANSVADLAKVLLDIDDSGEWWTVTQETIREKDRKRELRQMIHLMEQYEHGRLEPLRQEIADLEAKLALSAEQIQETSKVKLRKEAFQAKTKEKRMVFAVEHLGHIWMQARGGGATAATEENALGVTEERAKDEEQGQLGDITQAILHLRSARDVLEQAEKSPSDPPATPEQLDDLRSALTTAEDTLTDLLFAQPKSPIPSFPPPPEQNIPKPGPLRQKHRKINHPIFSSTGVKVSWENMLDAEHAPEWPEHVIHSPMGFTRYKAPDPTVEPVVGPMELKIREQARRKANWKLGLERKKAAKSEEKVWAEKWLGSATGQILEGMLKPGVERRKEEAEESAERRKKAIEAVAELKMEARGRDRRVDGEEGGTEKEVN